MITFTVRINNGDDFSDSTVPSVIEDAVADLLTENGLNVSDFDVEITATQIQVEKPKPRIKRKTLLRG